jgi:hypothetical protein
LLVYSEKSFPGCWIRPAAFVLSFLVYHHKDQYNCGNILNYRNGLTMTEDRNFQYRGDTPQPGKVNTAYEIFKLIVAILSLFGLLIIFFGSISTQ